MRGKQKRKDVELFALHFSDSIIALHKNLKEKTYTHGGYVAFKLNDPKPRDIHKASVGDRLLHHALYRNLYAYFDSKFIYDSYSCRIGKGTHRAIDRFRYFARKVSKNNTRTCWVLKCDIRKFFANIDHGILKTILAKHIYDKDTLWLLDQIIDSFPVGLPLGNLTSQLLVNIYMHEFDQFMKRDLKAKYCIRYADDFVFLSDDKKYLELLLPKLEVFLAEKLKLTMHPNKVFIKTHASGVDFLGWVHFPTHRTLRTSTKWRMVARLEESLSEPTRISYKGLLGHGSTYKIKKKAGLL